MLAISISAARRVGDREVAEARAFFQREWPSAKRYLERLVRLNSHSRNREGVEANARLVEKMFVPMGFAVDRIPSACPDFAPHLLLDNQGDGPALLMVSHLDTVFTPEEQLAGFREFESPDGLLTGPGTVDIKGGTVMMWLLLRAWAEGFLGDLPTPRWILGWNASEECLTADFAAEVVRRLPESTQACLVFEADNRKFSGHEVVTSRPGLARWSITATGRGAHSGNDHAQGLNAIVRLAQIVAETGGLTDYGRGLTVNVGTISGGVATNRVPDTASAEFEVRYRDRCDYERLVQKFMTWESAGRAGEVPLQQRCQMDFALLEEIDAWQGDERTQKLAGIWQRAAVECGEELTIGGRQGLSDANYLAPHLPTIDGLGPRGGEAHSIEHCGDRVFIREYVEPDSFISKALINLWALRKSIADLPEG